MPKQILGTGPNSIILSFLLFSITLGMNLPSFSYYGSILVLSFSALIIFYAILYGAYKSGKNRIIALLARSSFALSIVLFVLSVLLYAALGQASLNAFRSLENITFYFLALMLLFFILEVYLYLKGRKVRTIIIIIAIVLVVAYFSVVKYYADDEATLSYYGLASFLNGSNPYSQSFSGMLYGLHDSYDLAVTISTSNRILGSIQYPALFILVDLPFYFLSSHTYSGLSGHPLRYQATAFFLLFLLAYLLSDRKSATMSSPAFLAYISLAMLFNTLSSVTVFLMAALILMQYSKIGSRYSWLFLGLAASLQEQLWVIVILFIAYSFNNYGIRRGLRDLAGTVAVFLAINGYFILLGPGDFISNILGTALNPLPNAYSPVGYFMSAYLHVPQSAISYVFGLSVILAVLISLYVNDRKLILLFSIIPFMFLGHGLPAYYVLPISLFAIVASIGPEEHGINLLKESIAGNAAIKYAYVGAIVLAVLAVLAITAQSHSLYQSGFGLSSSNVRVSKLNSTTLIYTSSLHYVPGSPSSMYLLMQAASPGSVGFFGLYNQSLINDSLKCGFPCSINVNRINLSGSGSYNLTAEIPANMATPAYLSAVLYNNRSYYVSQPVAYK